jgi:hypothetical protein
MFFQVKMIAVLLRIMSGYLSKLGICNSIISFNITPEEASALCRGSFHIAPVLYRSRLIGLSDQSIVQH